ncbi:MAG: DUF3085 domain-containing protein [Gemmatimonadetes bacterium]|nr:DUF3085 domain-containing protein [Gemmatimonadota bacterium]
MEKRYEFDGAQVRALVQESRAASERVMTEAQRYLAAGIDLHAEQAEWNGDVDHPGTGAEPGLWLMNDRGVYLRSNARERDEGSVAFASGYRGDVPVGDDSTCEFIAADLLDPVRPGDTLVVTLDERKVRLSLVRPD